MMLSRLPCILIRGHAPQVERPEQVNGLLERFFARADALGSRRRVQAAA